MATLNLLRIENLLPGPRIMAKRLTRLSLCIVFFLSIKPIMAQMQSGSTTGQDMLRHCGIADRIVSGQLSISQAAPTAEDAMIEGFCVGAVAGVRFLAAASTKNTQYPICVPDNAPKSQVLSVVVRYLHNHPERLNDDLLWIIMDALREAWPCALRAQNPSEGQGLPNHGYATAPQRR
jgi:Ssp1 endopeptidase immunity protein Rap1a